VSHNASVIPVKHRDLMTAAYYQGGDTVLDFTDLDQIHEVAFADLDDATGQATSGRRTGTTAASSPTAG
jgi:hypothetical protein